MLRPRNLWLAAVLIASSVLTAAVVQAQPPTAQKGDRMFHRLQRNLGLTDDQVTQIRTVYQGQRDAHKQLWQSMRAAQKDLRQLALTGADANALAAKKTEVAQLQAQGLELRVQTLRQIGPILTPEQQQKLAEMGPGAMGRKHKGHRGPKPTQG